MIFRNARFFRFTKPFNIDEETLEAELQDDKFKPCGPQELSRQGWVPPLGKHSEQLVHVAGGRLLICLQKQEKILPGPVIKEVVEERCEEIEIEQGRKVRRKEKDEIKEQVTLELLPQAFTRTKRTFAYLSPQEGFMVVDAGSAKVAEDLASTLRKSLGSLPVRPPAVEQAPAFTFTGWLNETIDLPGEIKLGGDCILLDPSEDGGRLTVKGLDLKSDEVRNHLEAGMQVTKIAVEWDDNLTFTVDEELAIGRIKFGDSFQEQLDDVDADDAIARFDAAFSLMTLELSRLFPGLMDALGGEDKSAVVESDKDLQKEVQGIAPSLHTQVVSSGAGNALGDMDPLYREAEIFVVHTQRASVSGVQRKFKIGYNRAAHLIDHLESNGVVSPAGHDGVRQVLKAS